MKAIFFSPYSDVWVHSLPEAEIAEALVENGWELLRITCDMDFNGHCVAMAAKGVSHGDDIKKKLAICSSCTNRKSLLKKAFKFKDRSIGSLIDSDTSNIIKELVASVRPDNWFDFEIYGAPIGRMAFYDFALTYKMIDTVIPDSLWPAYINDLQNALKTYFAMEKLFSDVSADVLVTYNGMYATNNVAAYVARKRGCLTWALHAGHHLIDRFSTMYVYETSTLPVFSYQNEEWQSDRELCVTSEAAVSVTDHILELFRASNRFVYSSPLGKVDTEEIHRKFGILPEKKVLLATMSSADEIFAAKFAGVLRNGEVPLFESNFEWIKFLIEEIALREDLHLIIRVHPREFPNKRESQTSQNAEKLKSLLMDLPSNVSVNWPEDQISLYGMAHVTDVVLNASSSAGIEMLALGIPVVHHRVEHMLAYDPHLQNRVEDKSSYMSAIDAALLAGWSIENMRDAFRWWGFVFSRVAIDISDGFAYPAAGYISTEAGSKAKLRNQILTAAVKYGPSIQERLHIYRRRKLKNGQLISQGLINGEKILLSPRSENSIRTISEDEILNREARRLLEVLAESSSQTSKLVSNLKTAIGQY